jgi:acyl transferase domain-containing protein
VLADVAHTLTTGRHAFDHRAAVVATTVDDAVTALDALTTSDTTGTGTGSGPLRDDAQRWVTGTGPLPATRGRRIPLPTYPFQRQRHWIEPTRRGGQA